MVKHNQVSWKSLNYAGITESMGSEETKAMLVKNNVKSPSIKLILSMSPTQVRKQCYLRLFAKRKNVVNVAPDRISRIAAILNNMDAQKAANILNCF